MTTESFSDVIDAIFAKLAVRYGAVWLRQWDGLDMALVKSDWANELSGFANNLGPLRYALRNLPERCPNVSQFRALANSCPPPAFVRLPAPKASERVVAEQIAKQVGLMRAIAPKTDGKDWARTLIARHEAGEKVSPGSLANAYQAVGVAAQ